MQRKINECERGKEMFSISNFIPFEGSQGNDDIDIVAERGHLR